MAPWAEKTKHTDWITGILTGPLEAWARGDARALEHLITTVYPDLRRTARSFLRGEAAYMTLTPTVMIHEVYLRFQENQHMRFSGRKQFFWFVCRLMRQILVDHAREKKAGKRGAGAPHTPIEDEDGHANGPALDAETLLTLDEALTRLADLDARQALIVELRYFAGLSQQEIAGALDLSERTIKREWRTAKMWLARELAPGSGHDPEAYGPSGRRESRNQGG